MNPVRWDGGGLLTVAVRHNRPEILRLLLDYGFDPDERVSSGEGDWVAYSQGYPLWSCAALGRREMAEILLERGANPNVHVDSSGSAVYSAYSHKQWEMVELLRRHGGVVSADTAAIYRQTDLARQMLADDSGVALAEELLRFGASGGDPEIVRMALERIEWPRDDPRWFRCADRAAQFLAPHSVAVRGQSRVRPPSTYRRAPPHSGAVRNPSLPGGFTAERAA